MINFHKKRVLKAENLVYPKDVKELNDSIGDTSTLIGTLDISNRDYAFVDLDGNILIGDKDQFHEHILQNYLKTLNTDKYLRCNYGRPSGSQIEYVFNNEYCAFGHIIDNNIFIETYTLENISINDIISDINNAGIDYNKIYEYENDEITRVAKLIKQKNVK